MNIHERITTLVEAAKDDKTTGLWRVCREIAENVNEHNKQIIDQMRNYDTHDKEHSEKILEIIEGILGENIEKLSIYELILLYMAAYLHDSAMALPEWEYKVLKAVEGTEEYHDNTLEFAICNDYKQVHSFSEALHIIQENKEKLFSYETAKEYVCAKSSESDLLESLAELMRKYEEFRNGYIDDLDKCKDSISMYMNKSRWIRSEFIRQTHHIRVVENINALKRKITDAIGGFYTEKFIEDLAGICKSHGENLESVFQLPISRKDWLGKKSNIQFLAMMLRLGDIIHFDSKRAPVSLYAEKQITDAVSYKHWNAKFQELKYEIHNDDGKVVICYQAYCKEPEIYYFIQDYMDWIDNEIENYYILKNKWEMNKSDETEHCYFNIEKVDRTEIGYDKERFVPDKDMKFFLNQAKILELLMGIQLYKDPFLCLREIYQNALDASKCMKAYNKKRGKKEDLTIEFGIREEEFHGKKEKYIYCLDHGTGMNEYIIKNYLLNIGNSYYRSKNFAKENTDWGYDVKPTSQFGIGLLSGYMLADKIGITTIHYEEKEKVLSFILEGINEHFYYIKPSRVEEERIGDHGTLVKLYLKEEYKDKINNKWISKMPLALMFDDETDDIVDYLGKEFEDVERNFFYILNQYIGIKCSGIPVMICDEEEKKQEIYYCNTIFEQKKYNEISDEDMEKVFDNIFYLTKSKELYRSAIKKRNQIENYVIKAVSENMEIYSHIALPKKGIGEYKKIFDYTRFVGNVENSIFIDGILVKGSKTSIRNLEELDGIFQSDVTSSSIINYIGNKRPVLSIDRNTCVKFPKMKEELEKLRNEFADELQRIIVEHILKENITLKDPEQLMVLDVIVRKFPSISSNLLKRLNILQDVDLAYDKKFTEKNKYQLRDILSKRQLQLNEVDFGGYMEIIRCAILGRCVGADEIKVDGYNIVIQGDEYQEFPDLTYVMHSIYDHDQKSLGTMAMYADEWKGCFWEYDIVSKIWPIVNPCLYKCIDDGCIMNEYMERCKILYNFEDGIMAIANLDPVLIHPVYGIDTRKIREYEEEESYVGKFYNEKKQFELYEMTGYGKLTAEKNISYALYAYIAPRVLNETDEARLKEYNESDPDYVRGVKEGWSILFLGACQKYVICPGIVPRAEIAKKVNEGYRKMTPGITYLYSDGTSVFD